MSVAKIQALFLCPKTWKLLFLLAEHEIKCEKIHYFDLAAPDKWPIVDHFFSDLSYIFSNFNKFCPTAKQANLYGFWMNMIDCNIIPEIVMPLRQERVINPLVYGKTPSMPTLQNARAQLKEVLRKISEYLALTDWLDGEQLGLSDITLSTALAVLDYLGEISWNDFALKDLYSWYVKIKSRQTFSIVLQQKCPGILPHNNFAKIDF